MNSDEQILEKIEDLLLIIEKGVMDPGQALIVAYSRGFSEGAFFAKERAKANIMEAIEKW